MKVNATGRKGKTYTVTLDGTDVSNVCFNADEDGGFVDCYQTDSGGNMILEVTGVKDGWLEKDIATKRMFGHVLIYENIDSDKLLDILQMEAHNQWVRDFFARERGE